MEKIIGIVLLLTLTACIKTGNRKENINVSNSVNLNNCKNSIPFGDINVCLPIIEGMTECYSNPIIKNLVKKLSSENSTTIGIYLNDSVYNQIINSDIDMFTDYIYVYGVNAQKNTNVDTNDLRILSEYAKEKYFSKDWETSKSKINKKLHDSEFDFISFNKPVMIEQYKPHDKIQSNLLITRSMVYNEEMFSIMSMNLIIIKNRLIWYTYYLTYNGEKSITLAKGKSDYFGYSLLNHNE